MFHCSLFVDPVAQLEEHLTLNWSLVQETAQVEAAVCWDALKPALRRHA